MKRKLKKSVSITLISILVSILFYYTLTTVVNRSNGVKIKDKNLKETIDNTEFKIKYPKTSHDALNTWINELVDKTLKNEYQSDVELNKLEMSYLVSEASDEFLSIEIITKLNEVIIAKDARTLNLSNKELLTGSIFKDKAQNYLTYKLRASKKENNLSRNEFLDATLINEDFSNFFINNHLLKIDLNYAELEINLDEKAHLLNETLNSIEATNKDIPSVYLNKKYEASDKLVALTFDDGPHVQNSPKILAKLKEYNAYGTFFVIGQHIDNAPNVLVDILDQGHQLATHSVNHTDYTKMELSAVIDDIETVHRQIREITGFDAKLHVRPPFGAITQNQLNQLPYTFINWNVDTVDWLSKNASKVCYEATIGIEDGAIILMHDLYDSTVEALDCILSEIESRGFKAVTVEDLIEHKQGEVKVNHLYREG